MQLTLIFIGVKSLGKGMSKEGCWAGLFKILESLVNSEELDLEMIAILSKKTSCSCCAACGIHACRPLLLHGVSYLVNKLG